MILILRKNAFHVFRSLTLIYFTSVFIGCISFHPPGWDKNSETGVASWYGKDFHGKPTANGEIYDMYKLTAAHKVAPLGSYAVVKNIENGKEVTVKINDRGPFVRGRIIDLSFAAAKKIEMVGTGTARVKVTYLGKYSPAGHTEHLNYYLQVGSFLENQNAENLKAELSKKYEDVSIFGTQTSGKNFYRVCIGPLIDDDKIQDTKIRLEGSGFSPIATLGLCGFGEAQ